MKNKLLLVILLVVGLVGIAYALDLQPVGNTTIIKNNDHVANSIFNLINDNRHTYNVPIAQLDLLLSLKSFNISKKSPIDYISKPYDRFDYFVVSKEEWSRRYYSSPENIFDTWMNTDMNFRNDVLNRDYNTVGVGVSEDARNYYVSISWGY